MRRITNLVPYLCRHDLTVREALARINAAEGLFQLVVDETGRLVGTLTDGDIRRAMLRGVGLDDPIRTCANMEPLVGTADDESGNERKLRRLGIRRGFLPVLDARGRVNEILLTDGTAEAPATALVMAGGPGVRLGERTRNIPKPLLPVGDRPILEHVLGALEAAGVREVFVSVHYLADQIERFVTERASRASVTLIHERERMGTIGALASLPQPRREPILVVNGDVITHVDYNALALFHMRHGYDATIGVTRHDVEVPFGVIRHSTDGLFERIDEKPRISHFVAGGIYLLGPAFAPLVPPGRPMDMPELLNTGRSLGLTIGLFPIHEYWKDVGMPRDLAAAIRDFDQIDRTKSNDRHD